MIGRSAWIAVAVVVVLLAVTAVPLLRPVAPTVPAGVASSSTDARPFVSAGSAGGTVPPPATGLAPAARTAAPTGAPAGVRTDTSGWSSANFFQDVDVSFSSTQLSGPFEPEPIQNEIPQTDLGFWMNISAAAPILFANVTIWSTQWTTSGVPTPTTGFNPTDPHATPMVVDPAAPSLASFYFNDYRFFWPGSTVWFNVSVVGEDSSPSEVNSAWNDSVPVPYPGGFVNNATWSYSVDSPWASTNFSNDIAIATTPSVLGTPAYEPNRNQSLSIGLRAIDLGGTLAPIPDALLEFTVTVNGTSTAYSEAFGPVNQTSMSLDQAIGPYPGGRISFNVSAWLPWEGGEIDKIASPVYSFGWSPNGGWWHPLGGLAANAELAMTPAIPSVANGGPIPILPTASAVNITVHEPIENVTISSAQVDFRFLDDGLARTGAMPMHALSSNTSYALLPGLPPGAQLTFYLVAKDLNGDPISSGNYSYTEAGPTAPPLPSGRGLLFTEVLDLSGGGLLSGYTYTISNATWSTTGTASPLGFALPLLPNSAIPYELSFGAYAVSVRVFGGVESATVVLSPSSPTPTIVFYGESHAIPTATVGTLGVDSLAAAVGLIAAAVVTLPLVSWYEERRSRMDEEQRRVSL
jgi:hypothetical protein